MTPAVEAEDGVVYPLAVLGHGSVNSRKLGISTSLPPGHHAVHTTLTDERTTRVPLGKKSICVKWPIISEFSKLRDQTTVRSYLFI